MAASPYTSPVFWIDADGFHAPSYDDCYTWCTTQMQTIYGSDIVLTADTQDGQLVAIWAQSISDMNASAAAAYNSMSPASGQGNGLSSNVKINGLVRQAATYSTADVTIGGTAGIPITNGVIKDASGFLWSLPASVLIPASSTITVTATCQSQGAIAATLGDATINTPTLGWLTAVVVGTSIGAAQETDAQLRKRQSTSTAISAQSPMDSIAAAVEAVTGVTRVNWDENVETATNANGTPGHSFAMVVEGGDAMAIATTIARKKTPGTGTYGTISETVQDQYGIPSVIKFSTPTYERIIVNISIKAKAGYTTAIGNAIVSSIAAYINGLDIGTEVGLNDLIDAAIDGSGGKGTFKVVAGGVTIAIFGNTPTAADIPIAYNQAATCQTSDVTLSLTA